MVMRKSMRENNLDQEFKLALNEEMIFKWKIEGGINQLKKSGGKGLGVYDNPDRREHLVCFNERMRKIS